MKVIDLYRPRRIRKLAAALKHDYVPITDPFSVPDGDYYLVPASWWYKGKDKKAIECANAFNGKIVLMDYGREMEQEWKNKGGIRADYLVMMEDTTPNPIKVIPFSMPEFDPGILIDVPMEKNKKVVLVTVGEPKGKIVYSLIEYLSDYRIIWKMRNKYRKLQSYYEKALAGKDYMLVCPEEKDYNWPVSLVEVHGHQADMHVHIERLSFANQEMVRYGVPTYIWNGKKLVSHKRIERTKKFFEGKPKDYCTQNLVRFLREDFNSNR